jgi:hypothetical protein
MLGRLPTSVADVRVPDSPAARAAKALARDESSPMLYGYAVPSCLYAALLAGQDGTRYERGYRSVWDVLRVAPAVVRSFEAGSEGLDVICIGGRKPKGGDSERFDDFWD